MSSCSIMGMVFVTLMIFAIVEVGADHVHTHDDNNISPSSYTDQICEEVECGKGKCKVDMDYPFNFKCECEDGWKRTRYFDDDDFHFLPCTIPNCSLDYSCMPASAPTPAAPYDRNVSVYDPCHWIYCGEGTCNRNKTYRHTCECSPGYHNALNISFYPCYSDCALGSDCEKLGVVKSSNSTASTPANGGTRGTPYIAGSFLSISILAMSIVMVFWK